MWFNKVRRQVKTAVLLSCTSLFRTKTHAGVKVGSNSSASTICAWRQDKKVTFCEMQPTTGRFKSSQQLLEFKQNKVTNYGDKQRFVFLKKIIGAPVSLKLGFVISFGIIKKLHYILLNFVI